MKLLICLIFLFPIPAISQVGNSYKNYLHSEFADFFHTSEVKRSAYKNGEERQIKIGGFQDFINIYIYTDTVSSIIHEATLEVDREWLEEENTNGLARDLVKSFLLDFICTSDQAKVMAAGNLLFNRKTTQDKFALNVLDVFLNKKNEYLQQFSKCTVSLENFKQDGKIFFRLRVGETGK